MDSQFEVITASVSPFSVLASLSPSSLQPLPGASYCKSLPAISNDFSVGCEN
uniref:Uncharacterized protein n=1 Tax=Solanum tuberosum TaxID=4113 RepID=M1BI23_SOLTU